MGFQIYLGKISQTYMQFFSSKKLLKYSLVSRSLNYGYYDIYIYMKANQILDKGLYAVKHNQLAASVLGSVFEI